MTVEWKKQIAIAFLVKQRIWELDQGRLWELHYPELAATEEQLRAVQEKYIEELYNIWNQYKDIYAKNRLRELTLVE